MRFEHREREKEGGATPTHDRRSLSDLTPQHKQIYMRAVNDHYKKIYTFLVHLSRDASVAEDLTQETFTAAWQSMSQFEGRSSIGAWLHSIALNAYRAYCRSHHTEVELADESTLVDTQSQVDLIDQLNDDDLQRKAQGAIDRLPDIYREVMVMRCYQGLKHREIAKLLGIPIGTVQFRTHVAVEKLRVELNEELREYDTEMATTPS
jgi:RNA polymerase sigma-70 factor (ECF subfamily)